MKSLKQLGLQNRQTSNYADYISLDDKYVCCGWMDIHEDSDNCGYTPIFVVKPMYWHRDGVFVFKARKNKWIRLTRSQFIKKTPVEGITFNDDSFAFDARKLHGFVPPKIAARIDEKDYQHSDEYRKFLNDCGGWQSPKLVWYFETKEDEK